MHTPYARTQQQRRARAVYSTLRVKRPMAGLMAAELGALGFFALVVAGIFALRAWLAMPN